MKALRGFYAVLDRDDAALARALVRHARVLQVRLKPASGEDIARVAHMARRVCTEAGAHLIINDRIDIALAVGADGVHLGQTDVPVADARALVGKRLWIGVSTHDLEQVARAVVGGADYLGFGPVFATSTKQTRIQCKVSRAFVLRCKPQVGCRSSRSVASRRAMPATCTRPGSRRSAPSSVNGAADLAAAARAFRRPYPWLRRAGYVATTYLPILRSKSRL